MVRLSIVMPVFNEGATILSAIEQVVAVDYPCPVELVVVDDGSVDRTPEVLARLVDRGVRVVRHPFNRGKGAAVRSGVDQATGTHMIILDADLEYSPSDIPAMVEPVLQGRADHVFGTRVFGINTRYQSFRFAMGGRALTFAANVLYDSCLTDMHTCLKLLPVEDFRVLTLTENGFGLDTELTARLIRGGVRPYEVPVSYDGRSVEEGKKIGWRDGVRCLSILARVRAERQPQPLAITTRSIAMPQDLPRERWRVASTAAQAENAGDDRAAG
jgi:glycosyltransferase involved in cell wall biosynthesis